MLNGYFDLSLSGYLLVLLVFTQITIVSITVFLHRAQSHKSLTLHPILSHFFRFWLWMTTGVVTKQWVAVHRKHHAKTETKDDPHSPKTYGLKKVLLEGSELYRAAARDQETLDRYGAGTPDDWLERHVYSPHHALGVSIMLVINFFCFGFAGVAMWGIQMLWSPVWAAGVINGIGHAWGYRNSETPDQSTNIVPWGLWIGGEELHNNHHAFPNSAKLSMKPWEFDIGWMYIKLFSWVGLAKVNSIAPQLTWCQDKHDIERDTLSAVLTNRFQILKHYSQRVVTPVFLQERPLLAKKYHGLVKLSQLKRSMTINDKLLDKGFKEPLLAILDHSESLKIVYQFREKLQAIWQQSTANPKELLEALQDWCRQADNTGIQALQEFAESLKGYSLKTA